MRMESKDEDGEVTCLGVLGDVRTILPGGGLPRDGGDFSCYLPSSLPIIYETTGTSAVDMMLGRGQPLAFFHGVPIYFLSS